MDLKIKHKITFSFIALLVVIVTAHFIYDLQKEKKIRVSSYISIGNAIVQNTQYQIEHFIYIKEYVELQRLLTQMLEVNNDVKYAFIIGSDNKVLVHTFNDGFPEGLILANNNIEQSMQVVEGNNDSYYDFSYPLVDGKLGVLRIGISQASLIKDLKEMIMLSSIILIVVILIGAVLASVISKQISKPIINLVEVTKKVSKGKFDQEIKVNSKDETGELAVSFNFMCHYLKHLTNELKSKINELNYTNMEYEALNEEYQNQNDNLKCNLAQIEEMNEELHKAKNKAEEYDRLKSAFLANLSHEIRTPMNGIIGFAELLMQADLSEEAHSKYLNVIVDSSQQLLNLIHNLVDISMIESNQVKINLEECSAKELIDQIFVFYQPEFDKSPLELIREYPKRDYKIMVDRNKIIQVITNLVNNALKFTEQGQITIGFTTVDKALKFFVKDTGTGIPLDKQADIFNRFIQSDIKNKGCGLGLAISKSMVELHNGEIWVESVPEKGSEFMFTIPCKVFKGISTKRNQVANANTQKID